MVPLRGENESEPHPQHKILVPFRGSFQNFWRSPPSLLYGSPRGVKDVMSVILSALSLPEQESNLESITMLLYLLILSDWNPSVWPFEWKLWALSTFKWYCFCKMIIKILSFVLGSVIFPSPYSQRINDWWRIQPFHYFNINRYATIEYQMLSISLDLALYVATPGS